MRTRREMGREEGEGRNAEVEGREGIPYLHLGEIC